MPLKGHVLHVEVFEATYDFQKWFIPLGVHMVALAATYLELDTNHVWRCCQRSLVRRLAEADIECHHSEWGDMPQILMLKQFLHSEALSQAPVLMLPREVSNQLSRGDLRVSPRTTWGTVSARSS